MTAFAAICPKLKGLATVIHSHDRDENIAISCHYGNYFTLLTGRYPAVRSAITPYKTLISQPLKM